MKNRDECTVSVNAALSALLEDVKAESAEDLGKILTLMMSTCALGMLEYRGLVYTQQTIYTTLENVRSKALVQADHIYIDRSNPQ